MRYWWLVLLLGVVGCAGGGDGVRPTETAVEVGVVPTDEARGTAVAVDVVPTEAATETAVVPTPTEDVAEVVDPSDYEAYEIVTLLRRDAIPAIDEPTFLTAEDAAAEYAPDELVMGVVFEGEARAYSVPHLSGHEIVNDNVAGVKIAVTW